jgi:hypothetical protein
MVRNATGEPRRCLWRRESAEGWRKGGSRTRPYLDQHHSPFAIRYSPFFTIRHSPRAMGVHERLLY